jgi:hypothetical protein
MRMEKLPSSMVVHKRVVTLDTRLAEMDGELVSNPLEHNLGFYDFGRYTKAAEDADYAFVKLNNMWDEEIQAELNSDDEAENESTEASNSELEDNEKTAEAATTDTNEQPKGRERARLKRKQNEIESTKTADKRMKQSTQEDATISFAKELWNDVRSSVDKLFIIKRRTETNKRDDWHLVQLDLDETNNRQARTVGEYHVRYYVRHFGDAKKRLVRNCRFWPLIRELKPDGSFGDIIVLRPNKVEETLKKKPYTRGWYQDTMNLAEEGLVGPFNFSTLQRETYRIDHDIWKALEQCSDVTEGNVDISDTQRTIPLS